MIRGLSPYPKYKDSGVPWLGEVPEHWEVRRLKSSVAHINEQTKAKNPDDLYIALEHVESWTGRLRAPSGDVEFDSQVKRFRVGDVLFGKLRPYLAKVVRPEQDGVCVGEFFVLRPKHDLAPRYLEVVLRSVPAIDFVNSSTYGAKMPRADWTFVGGMFFPHPPLPEQTAIVRFLNWADRRIRRVIRAREKRIKLLEEYKQVLIHQAVTGQIDVRTGKPYPKYKNSGVEWLGQVPEHWEIVPLKWLAKSCQNGATPPTTKDSYYQNGSIPWYGPSSCNSGEIVSEPVRFLADVAIQEGVARLIHGPALLIVVIGATAGRMTLMAQDGTTNQQITAFELPFDINTSLFLLRQLRFSEGWLRGTASTATIPILNTRVVTRLPCLMPPQEEHEAIVEFLDEQIERIDTAIAATRREIDLLKEFCTRLIADVVTGKLDAREAAASLPDELDELELNNEINDLRSDEEAEASETLETV